MISEINDALGIDSTRARALARGLLGPALDDTVLLAFVGPLLVPLPPLTLPNIGRAVVYRWLGATVGRHYVSVVEPLLERIVAGDDPSHDELVAAGQEAARLVRADVDQAIRRLSGLDAAQQAAARVADQAIEFFDRVGDNLDKRQRTILARLERLRSRP